MCLFSDVILRCLLLDVDEGLRWVEPEHCCCILLIIIIIIVVAIVGFSSRSTLCAVGPEHRNRAIQRHGLLQLILEDIQGVQSVGIFVSAVDRTGGGQGQRSAVLRQAVDIARAGKRKVDADGTSTARHRVEVALERFAG